MTVTLLSPCWCLKFNMEVELLSKLCVASSWNIQNLKFRNNSFRIAFEIFSNGKEMFFLGLHFYQR